MTQQYILDMLSVVLQGVNLAAPFFIPMADAAMCELERR